MLMEDPNYIRSGNINDKWLDNIYENIKNLEQYERFIREGCKSILDFLNIPAKDRPMVISETQYKNLQIFASEFILLLADLTPVLDEDKAKEFEATMKTIYEASKNRRIFIKDIYDQNNRLVQIQLTPFFWKTVDTLHDLKVSLFKSIKNILYIGQTQ